MHHSWNKGFTKTTHSSVMKISETMRKKRIDNFALWRTKMKKEGHLKTTYKNFHRNGDLAELIGVILGDGHIEKFPRTERLLIFSNSNNLGFVKRYSKIVEKSFNKKPHVYNQKTQNCTRISLYEKEISKRLSIPIGSRKNTKNKVPRWILANREYIVRYLRGLYEAEGSVSHHLPTYTHKINFANENQSLLRIVHRLMVGLDFHPSIGIDRVQISRRAEVERAIIVLKFRKY